MPSLVGAAVVVATLRSERMHGSFAPPPRAYFHFFGLDYDKLRAAKLDALIMDPGPALAEPSQVSRNSAVEPAAVAA